AGQELAAALSIGRETSAAAKFSAGLLTGVAREGIIRGGKATLSSGRRRGHGLPARPRRGVFWIRVGGDQRQQLGGGQSPSPRPPRLDRFSRRRSIEDRNVD